MSLTLIVPGTWSKVDKLLSRRFPRRKATIPPASWVEELMAKRFGCLMICNRCSVKYGDGIKRWGYVRHPDMKASGNACDFCRKAVPIMPLYFKEEHRYPDQQQYAREKEKWLHGYSANQFQIRRTN